MRRILLATMLLSASLPAIAANVTPVVNSGTINYSTNQVTLTGTGFEPSKTAPTLLFNGTSISVGSFSNTQVVATLPTGTAAGTFNLTLTNSSGNSVVFDMTYGPVGPQGPAGPAGPTGAIGPQGPAGPAGATGPRGLTGAPGAPGQAGANGIGFTFLNGFDAYATYALNSVVTYNGSSYVAIVPNGPSPAGPTPDQSPSWSKMAAAGAVGATGPQGAQGPAGPEGMIGPLGNPGPTGPQGATGPQGPTGGVKSYASFTVDPNSELQFGPSGALIGTLTLSQPGTYLLVGSLNIYSQATIPFWVECYMSAPGIPTPENPYPDNVTIGPHVDLANVPVGQHVTAPLYGAYTATVSPTVVSIGCYGGSTSADLYDVGEGGLTAVQLQ